MQRYSTLFGKTKKSAKTFDSVNATLLQKAGFIHQEMAGVYTFLPLGLRVLTKIEHIVRDEMSTLGSELLMTTLAPKQNWERSGRLETVDVLMKTQPANAAAAAKHHAEYIVSPTHEDMITPIVTSEQLRSADYPIAVFQIQTKFRNEPRAKSGLMRGREFRMKDLYSFHRSQEEFKAFYEIAKDVYTRVFKRLGLGDDTYLTLASGGDFTSDYSHEFQTRLESGEDVVFLHRESGIAYNKEVAPADAPVDGESNDTYDVFRASEVGNIFPLHTRFSEVFDLTYTDEHGKSHFVFMGSYGIGTSRVMGVLVEKFHDEQGIIWPASVAPYDVHVIVLDEELEKESLDLITKIEHAGREVLCDERWNVRPGEKFIDADLIGIPMRIIVGKKSMEKGGFELKIRGADSSEILSLEQIVKRVTTSA
jgi:prolyl-tRNA synthetase